MTYCCTIEARTSILTFTECIHFHFKCLTVSQNIALFNENKGQVENIFCGNKRCATKCCQLSLTCNKPGISF